MTKPRKIVSIVSSRISNAEFLEQLFPPLASHEVLWWHHSLEDHKVTGKWHGRKESGFKEVIDTPNHNTFFSPALFDNSNGQAQRSSEYFSRLCVVVFDDADPAELLLQPTYIIKTSPGKFQVGYKLAEPVSDYEVAQTLIATLVAGNIYKKDKSGNNVVRYVRLPNGTNTHYGNQAFQELISFVPELTYTIEELEDFFGQEDVAPALVTGKWLNLPYELKKLKKNAEGKYVNGGRKELIRRWQMSMASTGKSFDEIENLVQQLVGQFDDTWDENDTRSTARSFAGAMRKAAKTRPQADPVAEVPDDLLEIPRTSAAWPEHPWLMKPYFMRGAVASINAPGGTGKSALVAAFAAYCAGALPFGPIEIKSPLRSVIVTYEDASDIYMRRLDSIEAVKHEHISDNIRVIQASRIPGDSNYWVERISGSNTEVTGAASLLGELVSEFKPDLIFLDTLSQLNGGDEDNPNLSKIIRSATLLAEQLNCCVVLIHHTGKEVARASIIDQYSGRGGSAISDNARSVLQLVHVNSPETAKKIWPGKIFEAHEDQGVVALVHVKSNFAMSASPLAFIRTPCLRTHSYALRFLDTSALPDAPSSDDKKTAKLESDIELAIEWLHLNQPAAINAVKKPSEFGIIKPAGMNGSLIYSLEAARTLGRVELVPIIKGKQKTQAFKVVD